MRRHKRENQILKGLIRAAAGVAACVAGLILFFVFIWWRGQHTYPQTDKEAAVQRQQAEPLVIETPEPATEGSIRVYDYDGCCIYALLNVCAYVLIVPVFPCVHISTRFLYEKKSSWYKLVAVNIFIFQRLIILNVSPRQPPYLCHVLPLIEIVNKHSWVILWLWIRSR